MKVLLFTSLFLATLVHGQEDARLIVLNGQKVTDVKTLEQVENSCYLGTSQSVEDVILSLIKPHQQDDIAVDIKTVTSSFGEEYLELTLASYGCFHDGGDNCEESFRIKECY